MTRREREILRWIEENPLISQQELADMIGTKKSTISRMENHAEDVRFSTIQKIAAACGKKVSIAFI